MIMLGGWSHDEPKRPGPKDGHCVRHSAAVQRRYVERVTLEMPAPLLPEEIAHVVAPSGPCRGEALWQGLAWTRTRYRLRMSNGVLSQEAYLAGSDSRRHGELQQGILDPGSKAILAARGGYGALRIVNDLPWPEFVRRPKWIVGYSDITVLHAMAWRFGIASIHGPNITGLGQGASPSVRAAWIASLERPAARRQWRGLRVLHAGEASGIIVGGNLSLLHALAAAGRLWIPSGAVLALEDVSEPPYRIDRMVTSLLLGGYLDRASAIVLGEFERCPPASDGLSVLEVLEQRTRTLGIPVLAGAPFGHGARNEAFVLGAPAIVRGDEVELCPP
jgi:muramoyltetrapeptide carboxypeptidase